MNRLHFQLKVSRLSQCHDAAEELSDLRTSLDKPLPVASAHRAVALRHSGFIAGRIEPIDHLHRCSVESLIEPL
jgi:hypothetical protein